MRNICFFVGSLCGLGGAQRMTASLINEFVKRNYSICVYSLYSSRSTFDIDPSVEIHSFCETKKMIIFHLPEIAYKLYLFCKNRKIEILINVDVLLSLFSLPVRFFLPDIKIIAWEHFNYHNSMGVYRRVLARKLSKRYADVIVTLTEEDRNYYLETSSKAKIVVIPNFISIIPENISDGLSHIVLAVGHLEYVKGFDLLLEVWNKVKQSSLYNDWKLQIVGDGSKKIALKNRICELHLEETVELIPATKDIDYYFQHASIYVMTSRFEGLPMVLLEAKSYALPIVSFDCQTGPKDLVHDSVDGFLVHAMDLNHMSDRLLELMNNDNLRMKLAVESRRSSFIYTKDSVILIWQNLFKSL